METLESLVHAIDRVRADCGDILGAVLATPEGLVLAGRGTLAGDVAAAAATHLADGVDRNLALLLSLPCNEVLMWTPEALWGMARLPSRHVVLAQGALQCATGTLRLALARLKRDLAPVLAELVLPEKAPNH